MDKSKDEFYDEDICTVETQIAIVNYALDAYGDELRLAATTGANRFLRNVQTHVNAVKDNAVDSLKVWCKHREDRKVQDVLQEVVEEAVRLDSQAEEPCEENDADDEDEDEDESVPTNAEGDRLLVPCSQRFFFRKLLKGERL